MGQLESVRRRLGAAESLLSVTRAMKALSAVRIRSFREAAESVASYHETLETGLQALLRTGSIPAAALSAGAPEPGRTPAGAVVFGSDLGLAGQFNVRVVDHAVSFLRSSGPGGDAGSEEEAPRVLAVGQRVGPLLEAHGLMPEAEIRGPEAVDSLPAAAGEIVIRLGRWRSAGVERLDLIHNRYRRGAEYAPTVTRLLPLDPDWVEELASRAWPTRCLPAFRGERDDVLTHLVREHLFVQVVRALADSLAAEHASRLGAMERAEVRIEEHLAELRNRFRQERGARITEEVLELSAGYEALQDEGSREDR